MPVETADFTGFSGVPSAAQGSDFRSRLYPILEKANCRACHNPEGVASATRLHFPDADAPASKIDAFGNSLVLLIDRDHPEASLLLNKPTARIPHTGGERIKPGSPEEAVLKAWIAKLAQLSGHELAVALKYRELENAGSGAASQDAELRRLTHSQYNHTVRDLLGDQTSPADAVSPGRLYQWIPQSIPGPEPLAASGGRLQQRGGEAGELCIPRRRYPWADSLQTLRPHAARVLSASSDRKRFGVRSMRESKSATKHCWRREADFMKGAQLVVEAMLQSPNFLFWLDATTDPKLKPWATASRLSYSLWDTMPDAELFAAARTRRTGHPGGRGEAGAPHAGGPAGA